MSIVPLALQNFSTARLDINKSRRFYCSRILAASNPYTSTCMQRPLVLVTILVFWTTENLYLCICCIGGKIQDQLQEAAAVRWKYQSLVDEQVVKLNELFLQNFFCPCQKHLYIRRPWKHCTTIYLVIVEPWDGTRIQNYLKHCLLRRRAQPLSKQGMSYRLAGRSGMVSKAGFLLCKPVAFALPLIGRQCHHRIRPSCSREKLAPIDCVPLRIKRSQGCQHYRTLGHS